PTRAAETRFTRCTLAPRLFARTIVGSTAMVGVRLRIYARAPATHRALLALNLTLAVFAPCAGRTLRARLTTPHSSTIGVVGCWIDACITAPQFRRFTPTDALSSTVTLQATSTTCARRRITHG